jgi:hypothetical protein
MYDILNNFIVNFHRGKQSYHNPSKKKDSTISLMIKLILFECIRRLLPQQRATNIHYNFNPSKQASQKHYIHVQRE